MACDVMSWVRTYLDLASLVIVAMGVWDSTVLSSRRRGGGGAYLGHAQKSDIRFSEPERGCLTVQDTEHRRDEVD